MSRSIADLLGWTRERFKLEVYVPLFLLLEATRLALAPSRDESIVRRAALALCALLALRLWDDLASLRRDARDHPERVLSRAPSRAPFIGAAVVGAACAFAMCATSPARLAILLGIAAYHAALYAHDAKQDERGVAASFAVLVKYPALAALLAAGDGVLSLRGLAALATLFASFCVYEVAHDASLRSLPAARAALDAAAAAVVASGLALAALAASHGVVAALVQGGLAASAVAAVILVVRATAAGRQVGALRWLLFVAVAAELSFVAMWRP